MQEEIEEKTVRLAITGSRLTVNGIISAVRLYMRHRANKKLDSIDTHIQGKQSIDELIKQNQGVASMEIGDKGIKTFERIAKKYGVDFAIMKDKNQNPPVYTAFFKARDTDALEAVMNEYAQKMVKREQRPSVREKLKRLVEKVKSQPKKTRTKKKEQVR
ncbi:PcfB family protein [Butyrivibrio fibrisolvens]|uniref:PcfB family protein n=1 Tax=Pseudobutyrivibrio ruminis TaxID=46206 RepID=UPI00041D3908|nr:PcfB family protein [Pseudobutyrivibrio ruminis]MDC7278023.1 PcfB family protein [Butyrivibrio fibrisolvens]